jgi:hypothetical protein
MATCTALADLRVASAAAAMADGGSLAIRGFAVAEDAGDAGADCDRTGDAAALAVAVALPAPLPAAPAPTALLPPVPWQPVSELSPASATIASGAVTEIDCRLEKYTSD